MSRPTGPVARQQHLLDAAIDVVGESGLRGLTHRAVDRRAGLPEGTCSVYFRTRLALLAALTEHVADRLAGDVDQVAERLACTNGDDQQAAITQAVDLLVRWSRDPALVITMTELSLEAVRTPSLQESVQRWRERLVGIVGSIIERIGKADGPRRAEAVVASLEGLAVAALNVPAKSRLSYLRQTTELLLTSLAAADTIPPK